MLTTEALVSGLEAFQDSWEAREVPSPSTVGACVRRQWCFATFQPRTERIPASTILSFERGKAMQPLAYAVLQQVGAKVSPSVTIPQKGLDAIGCERGEVDGLVTLDGECWLLEVKVLNAWGYLSFVEHGLRPDDPFDKVYLAQRQLYLMAFAAVGWPRLAGLLYMVFPADPSAAGWIAAKIKKWTNSVPPLITERVYLDPDHAGEMVGRAKLVARLRDNTGDMRDVPRDYDPFKPDKPCGYCGFAGACKEAG